jgi:hypothetical protein
MHIEHHFGSQRPPATPQFIGPSHIPPGGGGSYPSNQGFKLPQQVDLPNHFSSSEHNFYHHGSLADRHHPIVPSSTPKIPFPDVPLTEKLTLEGAVESTDSSHIRKGEDEDEGGGLSVSAVSCLLDKIDFIGTKMTVDPLSPTAELNMDRASFFKDTKDSSPTTAPLAVGSVTSPLATRRNRSFVSAKALSTAMKSFDRLYQENIHVLDTSMDQEEQKSGISVLIEALDEFGGPLMSMPIPLGVNHTGTNGMSEDPVTKRQATSPNRVYVQPLF